MAPKKSTGEDNGKSVAAPTTSKMQTRSMDRLTRSETRRRGVSSSGSSSSKLMNFESPEKKKRKAKAKEGGAKKKIKTAAEIKKEEESAEESAEEDDVAADEGAEEKKIVIEHCKQCNSFKTRANQVKAGLEKAVPGIVVTVNSDKPRRGCFEIREEGGETFISLLNMKRPFKPMKDLDMEQVIADIVEKIK